MLLMTGPFDIQDESYGNPSIPPSPSFKASVAAAIRAEPGLEMSEVRVSASRGEVVLEGYVLERNHVARVFAVAESIAGRGRVRSFVFHRL